ncbi:hypothetical protein BJ875DRAFT_448395 [Amylocarpus encephaloides]|uniref:DUF7730 domain-containing protein n=1 Tax=Amylocarpus encephaloides TaxID=45428 RepID=A0A9P7YU98_9HELO|nr:hypothetical protein BJ875DRAFT_448395 [Amylocarpus encephaloides]
MMIVGWIRPRWCSSGRDLRPKYPTDITKRRQKFGKNVKLDKWTPRRAKKGGKVENATPIHSNAWAASILPQDCLLLSLPVEVRQQIYGYLFNETIVPRICSYSFIDFGKPCINAYHRVSNTMKPLVSYTVVRQVSQITTLAKSLSLVSRRVYLDTRYYLYQHTMFRFENHYYLKTYFSHVSTFKVNMLRNIQIWHISGRGDVKIPRPLLKRLSTLPSLRLLEFIVTIHPHWVHGTPQFDRPIVDTLAKADWSLFQQSGLRTIRFQFDTTWNDGYRSCLEKIDFESPTWKGFVAGVQRDSGVNVPAVSIVEFDREVRESGTGRGPSGAGIPI